MFECGSARGALRAERAARIDLARGMVAMEDGLGLQVVIGHPALDSAEAERILVRFAATAAGIDPAALDRALPAVEVAAAATSAG